MNIINRLLHHELVSGSFYLFIGSMVANLTAFLLNLFYARSLTYADYGIFASLLSIITLIMIPASSLNTIIIKFATDYFIKNDLKSLNSLYFLFLKFILVASIIFLIIFSITSNLLLNFLNIDNYAYILLTGFAIVFFYFSAINTAFLQSELKFAFISFLNAFGGFIKLISGVILVILGFKAFSGIWAIIIMGLGMYFIAFLPLKKIFTVNKNTKNISLDINKIISFALPTFLAILFMTSFTSMDVILVKHYFTPHQAGLYAGLSLVGKVIFYFTAPIPLVMFPLLVKRNVSGKGFINIFVLSLMLVILPSLFITGIYFVYPKIMINLFLGGREYLILAKYLGIFGIFLTIFSLINLFVNFFLSLGNTKIVIPVIFAAILQILFISIYHQNILDIISISIYISIGLLLFLGTFFIIKYKKLFKFRETFVQISSNI